MPRTLIAAFGNELRGDDGLGIEVIRRLEALGPLGDGVTLTEIGTAGLRLAQELLTPYDHLIIVDAMTRGGVPGEVYVREVEAVEWVREIDLHLAFPAPALAVAQALGVLPRRVFMVGCEPAEVDELTTALSPPVRDAVDTVVSEVLGLLKGERRALPDPPSPERHR